MDKKTELGVNGSRNGQWKRLLLAAAKSKRSAPKENRPGSVPQPFDDHLHNLPCFGLACKVIRRVFVSLTRQVISKVSESRHALHRNTAPILELKRTSQYTIALMKALLILSNQAVRLYLLFIEL